MTIGEIITKWEECGLQKHFSLSSHYTKLFDDEEVGFDYLFSTMGMDKEDVKAITDPKIIALFNQMDSQMMVVSELIENFITDYLFKESEIEDIKDQLDILRMDIRDEYQKVFDISQSIKTLLTMEGQFEEFQMLH